MDFFGEDILNVLRDGKPKDFHQLLREVDFSYNTLRLNLTRLVDQGLILKEKTPSKGRGRPRLTYSLSPKLHRQAPRLLSDPVGEVVTPFPEVKAVVPVQEGWILQENQEEM
jgi:predicted ArsR family transcriptional regulator